MTDVASQNIEAFFGSLVGVCHQTSPGGLLPLLGNEGERLQCWDYLAARWAEAVQLDADLLQASRWRDARSSTRAQADVAAGAMVRRDGPDLDEMLDIVGVGDRPAEAGRALRERNAWADQTSVVLSDETDPYASRRCGQGVQAGD